LMRAQKNCEMLELAAERLGALCDEVVWVGGVIVNLLITDLATPEVGVTMDCDVIVSVTAHLGYAALGERLRRQGFMEDSREGAPICRYRSRELGDLCVDVMPTDPTILGFSNRWFELAFRTATQHQLPSGRLIRVASAPCFLATKLVAFASRGAGDWQGSKDIEDLLAVIHGRMEIVEEIAHAPAELRSYLEEQARGLLLSGEFKGSIEGHLPGEDPGVVLGRLRVIAGLL
jgi:hypothetical protein